MKPILAALAFLLFAGSALAETPIVLELTREEATNIRKALDAVVKGGGLDAAHVFIPIDDKLIAAGKEAQDADARNAETTALAEARKKVEAADKAKAPPSP